MKATLERSELVTAVRAIEPLLGERQERSRVRIDAEASEVRVSGTDSTQMITWTIPSETGATGSALVAGRVFTDFVKLATGAGFTLEFTEETLTVRSSDAVVALGCYPLTEWPQAEHLTTDPIDWAPESLQSVGRVLHAACDDMSRPALCGICFRDGWAAATDARRLAAVRVPLIENVDAVIPGAAIASVLRLASGSGARFSASDTRVTFSLPRAHVSTALVAAPFPQWSKSLPPRSDRAITALRQDLVDALTRMNVIATKAPLHSVTISDAPPGSLQLSSDAPDIGHQEDRIAGTNTVGDVSFGLTNLRDAIEHASDLTVRIEMDGPLSPAVIHEKTYLALVMPIRG